MAVFNLTRDNNLDCKQGATWIVPIQWQDALSSVVMLSGNYAAKMQVKDRFGGLLLIELSTYNGRITYDSAENIVLMLTADETSAFEAGMYIYDLKLIPIALDGTTVRLLEGEFEVTPEVTI